MKKKIIVMLISIILISLFTASIALAEDPDRDRYTNWSQYYNGVCFRYANSYLGMDQWSSWSDRLQFYNSQKNTAKIDYKTTAGGPRLLYLKPGTSDKIALAQGETITEITVTYEPSSWNLEGTWYGTGYQGDGTSWSIELIVRGNSYTILYRSLSCSGYWNLNSMDTDSASFTEHITQGQKNCINNGNVMIRKIDENSVDFSYEAGNPKYSARAKLIKGN